MKDSVVVVVGLLVLTGVGLAGAGLSDANALHSIEATVVGLVCIVSGVGIAVFSMLRHS